MKSKDSTNVIYKEVVIIGNGPSAIALSYMLSGNLPLLISDSHPDEMLSMRLATVTCQNLIEEDLGHLAAGLEGRSTNPISLLLDALLHPCADIGLEMAPLVEFKKFGAEIDHIVLGKGPPGGLWHKMDPYILTLSLGTWMALPGLPFNSRDSGEKRAYACNVAKYYVNYVKEMNLSKYFINSALVTNIAPLKCDKSEIRNRELGRLTEGYNPSEKISNAERPKTCILSNAFNYIMSRGNRKLKPSRCCKRPREQDLCQRQSPDRKIREVNTLVGPNLRNDRNRYISFSFDSINYCDNSYNNIFNTNYSRNLDVKNESRVPFRINPICDPDQESCWSVETCNVESGETTTYHCKYVVLANGSSDLPNRLDFSKTKQDPTWLFYDLRNLEHNLDQYLAQSCIGEVADPVLIVGAGLSAADAVIATRERKVPVVHVFRNKLADLNRQLPENMYPEYHKVHQMMQDGGSTYPLYTAYPEYHLSDVDEGSRSVTLISNTGDSLKIRVSFVAVLIGSRPDLSFLPSNFHLGVEKNLPIDCKTNTLQIDKLTHCVDGFTNLFALGPLAGDNFVRFIPGGALAVVSELYRQNIRYRSCFK